MKHYAICICEVEVRNVFDIPLIDWNGNGEIDSSDVAMTLAMNDANGDDEDED